MPQMSPLLWLNLLSFFLFSFFCFIVLNYFIWCPTKSSVPIKSFKGVEKSWKW